MPEAFHGLEKEPLRDDLATLGAEPRATGVACHAGAETVFALILLTWWKVNSLSNDLFTLGDYEW